MNRYNSHKYIAQIPARIGSKRVKKKNIRLLNGKPMIQYAIDACKGVDEIGQVYVNTDSDEIGSIAISNKIECYKRDKNLASDLAKQDEFNYDFMRNVGGRSVIMINPVSPLIESVDIKNAIDYFESHNLDSLISVKREQLHTFYRERALNFNPDSLLPPTQEIDPVLVCTWSICIWKVSTFVRSYEQNGYAAFNGKVGYWELDPLKATKVSQECDFRMVESIIRARKLADSQFRSCEPQYFKCVV